MKVVFLSNFLSHHQTEYCEEMHKLCEGNFFFVATSPITEERQKLGYYDYSNNSIPYYIDGTNEANYEKLKSLIRDADAVMIGSAPWHWVEERVRDNKLVYIYSERIFKTLVSSLKTILRGTVSTRFIKAGRMQNVKLFCASAYLPMEMKLLHTFRNRMYRWGYFPPLFPKSEVVKSEIPTIIFAGRLIDWKRPWYVLRLAEFFKKMGLKAKFVIIGTGNLEEKLKSYVKKQGLSDCVTFTGALPPNEVRRYMEQGNIFLFTSTKEEGWGAVLNEAMNSGCAVVASGKIGSVPFLIKNGENGLVFRDGSFSDFKKQVIFLCQNKRLADSMGEKAYETVSSMWNGKTAAQRFAVLTEKFLRGEDTPFDDGPCSKVSE